MDCSGTWPGPYPEDVCYCNPALSDQDNFCDEGLTCASSNYQAVYQCAAICTSSTPSAACNCDQAAAADGYYCTASESRYCGLDATNKPACFPECSSSHPDHCSCNDNNEDAPCDTNKYCSTQYYGAVKSKCLIRCSSGDHDTPGYECFCNAEVSEGMWCADGYTCSVHNGASSMRCYGICFGEITSDCNCRQDESMSSEQSECSAGRICSAYNPSGTMTCLPVCDGTNRGSCNCKTVDFDYTAFPACSDAEASEDKFCTESGCQLLCGAPGASVGSCGCTFDNEGELCEEGKRCHQGRCVLPCPFEPSNEDGPCFCGFPGTEEQADINAKCRLSTYDALVAQGNPNSLPLYGVCSQYNKDDAMTCAIPCPSSGYTDGLVCNCRIAESSVGRQCGTDGDSPMKCAHSVTEFGAQECVLSCDDSGPTQHCFCDGDNLASHCSELAGCWGSPSESKHGLHAGDLQPLIGQRGYDGPVVADDGSSSVPGSLARIKNAKSLVVVNGGASVYYSDGCEIWSFEYASTMQTSVFLGDRSSCVTDDTAKTFTTILHMALNADASRLYVVEDAAVRVVVLSSKAVETIITSSAALTESTALAPRWVAAFHNTAYILVGTPSALVKVSVAADESFGDFTILAGNPDLGALQRETYFTGYTVSLSSLLVHDPKFVITSDDRYVILVTSWGTIMRIDLQAQETPAVRYLGGYPNFEANRDAEVCNEATDCDGNDGPGQLWSNDETLEDCWLQQPDDIFIVEVTEAPSYLYIHDGGEFGTLRKFQFNPSGNANVFLIGGLPNLETDHDVPGIGFPKFKAARPIDSDTFLILGETSLEKLTLTARYGCMTQCKESINFYDTCACTADNIQDYCTGNWLNACDYDLQCTRLCDNENDVYNDCFCSHREVGNICDIEPAGQDSTNLYIAECVESGEFGGESAYYSWCKPYCMSFTNPTTGWSNVVTRDCICTEDSKAECDQDKICSANNADYWYASGEPSLQDITYCISFCPDVEMWTGSMTMCTCDGPDGSTEGHACGLDAQGRNRRCASTSLSSKDGEYCLEACGTDQSGHCFCDSAWTPEGSSCEPDGDMVCSSNNGHGYMACVEPCSNDNGGYCYCDDESEQYSCGGDLMCSVENTYDSPNPMRCLPVCASQSATTGECNCDTSSTETVACGPTHWCSVHNARAETFCGPVCGDGTSDDCHCSDTNDHAMCGEGMYCWLGECLPVCVQASFSEACYCLEGESDGYACDTDKVCSAANFEHVMECLTLCPDDETHSCQCTLDMVQDGLSPENVWCQANQFSCGQTLEGDPYCMERCDNQPEHVIDSKCMCDAENEALVCEPGKGGCTRHRAIMVYPNENTHNYRFTWDFRASTAFVVGAGNNLYVARARVLYLVDLSSGVNTVLAGSMIDGATTDGDSTQTRFNYIIAMSYHNYVDVEEVLFIADRDANTLRRFSITTGVSSTMAGNGVAQNADHADGLQAGFNEPQGVVYHSSGGFVLVASTYRIASVDLGGNHTVTNLIGSLTVEGPVYGNTPANVRLSAVMRSLVLSPTEGELFFLDLYDSDGGPGSFIVRHTFATGATTSIWNGGYPDGMTSKDGNLFYLVQSDWDPMVVVAYDYDADTQYTVLEETLLWGYLHSLALKNDGDLILGTTLGVYTYSRYESSCTPLCEETELGGVGNVEASKTCACTAENLHTPCGYSVRWDGDDYEYKIYYACYAGSLNADGSPAEEPLDAQCMHECDGHYYTSNCACTQNTIRNSCSEVGHVCDQRNRCSFGCDGTNAPCVCVDDSHEGLPCDVDSNNNAIKWCDTDGHCLDRCQNGNSNSNCACTHPNYDNQHACGDDDGRICYKVENEHTRCRHVCDIWPGDSTADISPVYYENCACTPNNHFAYCGNGETQFCQPNNLCLRQCIDSYGEGSPVLDADGCVCVAEVNQDAYCSVYANGAPAGQCNGNTCHLYCTGTLNTLSATCLCAGATDLRPCAKSAGTVTMRCNGDSVCQNVCQGSIKSDCLCHSGNAGSSCMLNGVCSAANSANEMLCLPKCTGTTYFAQNYGGRLCYCDATNNGAGCFNDNDGITKACVNSGSCLGICKAGSDTACQCVDSTQEGFYCNVDKRCDIAGHCVGRCVAGLNTPPCFCDEQNVGTICTSAQDKVCWRDNKCTRVCSSVITTACACTNFNNDLACNPGSYCKNGYCLPLCVASAATAGGPNGCACVETKNEALSICALSGDVPAGVCSKSTCDKYCAGGVADTRVVPSGASCLCNGASDQRPCAEANGVTTSRCYSTGCQPVCSATKTTLCQCFTANVACAADKMCKNAPLGGTLQCLPKCGSVYSGTCYCDATNTDALCAATGYKCASNSLCLPECSTTSGIPCRCASAAQEGMRCGTDQGGMQQACSHLGTCLPLCSSSQGASCSCTYIGNQRPCAADRVCYQASSDSSVTKCTVPCSSTVTSACACTANNWGKTCSPGMGCWTSSTCIPECSVAVTSNCACTANNNLAPCGVDSFCSQNGLCLSKCIAATSGAVASAYGCVCKDGVNDLNQAICSLANNLASGECSTGNVCVPYCGADLTGATSKCLCNTATDMRPCVKTIGVVTSRCFEGVGCSAVCSATVTSNCQCYTAGTTCATNKLCSKATATPLQVQCVPKCAAGSSVFDCYCDASNNGVGCHSDGRQCLKDGLCGPKCAAGGSAPCFCSTSVEEGLACDGAKLCGHNGQCLPVCTAAVAAPCACDSTNHGKPCGADGRLCWNSKCTLPCVKGVSFTSACACTSSNNDAACGASSFCKKNGLCIAACTPGTTGPVASADGCACVASVNAANSVCQLSNSVASAECQDNTCKPYCAAEFSAGTVAAECLCHGQSDLRPCGRVNGVNKFFCTNGGTCSPQCTSSSVGQDTCTCQAAAKGSLCGAGKTCISSSCALTCTSSTASGSCACDFADNGARCGSAQHCISGACFNACVPDVLAPACSCMYAASGAVCSATGRCVKGACTETCRMGQAIAGCTCSGAADTSPCDNGSFCLGERCAPVCGTYEIDPAATLFCTCHSAADVAQCGPASRCVQNACLPVCSSSLDDSLQCTCAAALDGSLCRADAQCEGSACKTRCDFTPTNGECSCTFAAENTLCGPSSRCKAHKCTRVCDSSAPAEDGECTCTAAADGAQCGTHNERCVSAKCTVTCGNDEPQEKSSCQCAFAVKGSKCAAFSRCVDGTCALQCSQAEKFRSADQGCSCEYSPQKAFCGATSQCIGTSCTPMCSASEYIPSCSCTISSELTKCGTSSVCMTNNKCSPVCAADIYVADCVCSTATNSALCDKLGSDGLPTAVCTDSRCVRVPRSTPPPAPTPEAKANVATVTVPSSVTLTGISGAALSTATQQQKDTVVDGLVADSAKALGVGKENVQAKKVKFSTVGSNKRDGDVQVDFDLVILLEVTSPDVEPELPAALLSEEPLVLELDSTSEALLSLGVDPEVVAAIEPAFQLSVEEIVVTMPTPTPAPTANTSTNAPSVAPSKPPTTASPSSKTPVPVPTATTTLGAGAHRSSSAILAIILYLIMTIISIR